MQLLDGNTQSQKILLDLKDQISKLSNPPRLDIILVGDNPASLKYVDLKQKRAGEIGLKVIVHHLPQSVSQSELISLINQLNSNPLVIAFFIQLPLPSAISRSAVLNAIDPTKDVDGLTPTNLGLLFHHSPQAIAPATALGVIKLLEAYQINIVGKNAVIVGRSPEVGLPLLALLESRHATVTLCHSQTQNLTQITQSADILISATGRANLITPAHVKAKAIVVDIGSGDVDFSAVKDKCSFITPTIGGVGPMTIATLLANTVDLITTGK